MRRTIYSKLVLGFICVFIISNIFASLFTFLNTEISTLEQLGKQLTESVDIVKDEYEKGNVSKEGIQRLFKDNYINISFIDDIEGYGIEEEAVSLLKMGKTLTLRTNEYGNTSITTPVAIGRIKDYYIVAKPEFENLGFSARSIIMSINTMAIISGSILFLFVGRLMVIPIKKLIKATEKVAQGDFDARLENKRVDEMGMLISSFNTMAEELKSIEIFRNNFISDISHEFRTPLTSIEGYTKLLIDCNEEERREYADIIIEETKRLSILTTNILTLNKIDNQNIPTLMEDFTLDEQIRKSILLLEKKWIDKDIELEIDLEKILYRGNSSLMYQVWINLIDNAIKFSPKGRKIEIKLYEEYGNTIFSIKDNGVGISKEDQKKMFEKFYKGDKSRNTDGNGLGLSIVKRIVEIHNGKMLVESSIGVGTNIIVKLYK
ncbi:HAMP domain-containing sensor histidine kinase [Tissierella sp. MB52-C2]|uniref:sensor histidine kinase n=1 Tax=Tissierella sp. MB52-C2 TaxID=3070999 RepID=UPI00280C20DA|nr:HAMP domain-containing sensor histidine kinase [Tissierella sp. MB52-C2]WMM26258.1 HAMP domain-containing sensor histidine kinase [Tissierella sp. MB52-C2]